MPRPSGWIESKQQRQLTTHNLLLVLDWMQCNLKDHLEEMRADDGNPQWRSFIDGFSKLAEKDVEAAGWVWLIEILLAEYVFVLRESRAWAGSILHVDSDVRTATKGTASGKRSTCRTQASGSSSVSTSAPRVASGTTWQTTALAASVG
jgi:hypothetical protein